MLRQFAIVVERGSDPPDYAALRDGGLWYTSVLKPPEEGYLCGLSALAATIAVVRAANQGTFVAAYETDFIDPTQMKRWWAKNLREKRR
jgi:hypothetical protein